MKHAKKISLSVDMPWLNKTLPVIGRHYAKDAFGAGTGEFKKERLIRKYLPKKYVLGIKNAIPEALQPYFLAAGFSEISLLTPHVHIKDKCVINFYLKTNGETTYFWDGEAVPDNTLSTDNGNGYWALDMNCLSVAESFTAASGDVWLLNTHAPHSVSFANMDYEPKNDERRLVVQAFLSAPFDEAAIYF